MQGTGLETTAYSSSNAGLISNAFLSIVPVPFTCCSALPSQPRKWSSLSFPQNLSTTSASCPIPRPCDIHCCQRRLDSPPPLLHALYSTHRRGTPVTIEQAWRSQKDGALERADRIQFRAISRPTQTDPQGGWALFVGVIVVPRAVAGAGADAGCVLVQQS